MKTRSLFIEALNPYIKVANSIAKKLNYMETSLITDFNSYENAKRFLLKVCAYHSNAFNEMDQEAKNIITKNVYDIITNSINKFETVSESDSTEELEAKIYNFLKTNGGILYPLETSAKKLAAALSKKEDN